MRCCVVQCVLEVGGFITGIRADTSTQLTLIVISLILIVCNYFIIFFNKMPKIVYLPGIKIHFKTKL